jgi:hypothetical protein
MKKIFVTASVLGLLALASCSGGAASLLGGSWTFKSINYSAVTAVGSTTASTLTATTGSTSEVDDVVMRFPSFPPAPGPYTVVNTPSPAAGQVYILVNIGTKGYTIASSGSVSATVTANGSKVNVSVPSADFSNITLQATDDGPFTATITQNL